MNTKLILDSFLAAGVALILFNAGQRLGVYYLNYRYRKNFGTWPKAFKKIPTNKDVDYYIIYHPDIVATTFIIRKDKKVNKSIRRSSFTHLLRRNVIETNRHLGGSNE